MATEGSRPPASGNHVKSWREQLIEPRDEVVGDERRRRARYTTVTLGVLIPLAAVAMILALVTDGDSGSASSLLIGFALLAFLVLWPLSRTRHHDATALAALIVTSTTIVSAWWFAGAAARHADTLYYLVLPIWMSSFLLKTVRALFVASISVLFASTLAIRFALMGDPEYEHVLPVPLLLALAGGLALNAARLRDHDLRRADELAARLQDQERVRLEMLNIIAHDLASPLTPLKIQVRLIPKDKPLPAERVSVIERNIKQMERLVADVKDLARLDAGALSTKFAPTDLTQIARRAIEAFEEDAKSRGLTLVADLAESVPIEADTERLTQVAYNLVTNALKFTPPNGEVRVITRAVDGMAELRVRDSGRGLAPEETSRLFKPFSQVHERSEVKERGTGLGLYISRGIAKAHGGNMSVASEGRGRGSTFTLTLPLRSPPSAHGE